VEILPNIHRISTPMGDRVVHQYLFVGEKVLLFDTGLDTSIEKVVSPYLKSIGLDLGKLHFALVSHADGDHLGGNQALKHLAPQALLMAHNLDLPMIEDVERLIEERYNQFYPNHELGISPEVANWVRQFCKSGVHVDIGLEGGETFRLQHDWELKVLHVPGHTYGHLCVYDAKNRLAAIGDAVLGEGVPDAEGQRVTLPPTYIYVDTYLSSIKALLNLPIDILLTGHFPVMRGKQVTEFLYGSLFFAQRLEEGILQTVREAQFSMTLKEIILTLSSRIGSWPAEACVGDAAFPFSGHLQRLENFGLIRQDRKDNLVAWRIA
jgi:glyoxylase-like metal-dependent hydrolase (beta-lactamase superfamily II)